MEICSSFFTVHAPSVSWIKIGQWLGICVKRLNVVPEYFDGQMEATTTITYAKQMIYLITTPGFFMLTLIMFAEVKLSDFKF